MSTLCLEREVNKHSVVVTLVRSEGRVIVSITTPSGSEQHEHMDIQPLLAGGMTESEALEHVVDLIAAWLNGSGIKDA